MPRYSRKRALANSLRMSAMGKASQRVQSEARMALVTPEYIRRLEEIKIENLPRKQGDPLGVFQWTDFRSGKVRRWVIRIGARSNQVTLETPGGKTSKSHGGTFVMNYLRGWIFGEKRFLIK